jgi:hypothetical protein
MLHKNEDTIQQANAPISKVCKIGFNYVQYLSSPVATNGLGKEKGIALPKVPFRAYCPGYFRDLTHWLYAFRRLCFIGSGRK